MDLVRNARSGRIALATVLALAVAMGQAGAEPPAAAQEVTASRADMAALFEAAFRPAVRAPLFVINGATMHASSGMPARDPPAIDPRVFPLSVALAAPRSSPWRDHVAEAATRFGVPAAWVQAVMQVESGGRTMLNGRPITSSAGAMGLMQVMPDTFAELARRHGLGDDPHEPRANILAGAAYMREMLDRYGAPAFLAAYNAGPGRLDDYILRGRPLPEETRRYVAALAPKLAGTDDGRLVNAGPVAAHPTGAEQASGAASAPADTPSPTPQRAPASPLFVATGTAPSSTGPRSPAPPADTLFVPLPRLDRRRTNVASPAERD